MEEEMMDDMEEGMVPVGDLLDEINVDGSWRV